MKHAFALLTFGAPLVVITAAALIVSVAIPEPASTLSIFLIAFFLAETVLAVFASVRFNIGIRTGTSDWGTYWSTIGYVVIAPTTIVTITALALS